MMFASRCQRNSKLFRALLHFCVFVAIAAPASAQVYKWVDENGVTHYGERPPQGRKATEVPNRLATPAPEAGAIRREDQDKAPADAVKRREQCLAQRALLARLKQAPPSYAQNEQGERVLVGSAEREATLARQEQAVVEACSG